MVEATQFVPEQIWSGGQTGADQGGLAAAASLNIPTRGWMPRGWRTEEGPAPSIGARFGLKQHINTGYQPRTILNVQQTDATVIFGDPTSSGSKLTREACERAAKPFLLILGHSSVSLAATELRKFLNHQQPRRLNIAGNRTSKNRGIHDFTKATIVMALASTTQVEEGE